MGPWPHAPWAALVIHACFNSTLAQAVFNSIVLCQNTPLQHAFTTFALLHSPPPSLSVSRDWSWLTSKPACHPHWNPSN